MNFRPELARLAVSGRKTVTRRLVSSNPRSPWSAEGCRLRVGHDYAVCPGRGKDAIGRVGVVSVSRQRLGDVFGDGLGEQLAPERYAVANSEAMREGFRSPVDFQLAWLKINRTWDPDALVWRVEFVPV